MSTCAVASEEALIDRLRTGDAACFSRVVAELSGTLRWIARGYLTDDGVVDEVVQDTWLDVMRGLDDFAGRSTLRTWVCTILVNRARTLAAQDARVARAPVEEAEALSAAFSEAGTWAVPPRSWRTESPAKIGANKQALALVRGALDRLPQRQREIVALRDLYGWTSAEICEVLELSEANQLALLHRGRARLRDALEALLARPVEPLA